MHVARDVLRLVVAKVRKYEVLCQYICAREATTLEDTDRWQVSRVAQGVKPRDRQVLSEYYNRCQGFSGVSESPGVTGEYIPCRGPIRGFKCQAGRAEERAVRT
jgi:hypothetical protein